MFMADCHHRAADRAADLSPPADPAAETHGQFQHRPFGQIVGKCGEDRLRAVETGIEESDGFFSRIRGH